MISPLRPLVILTALCAMPVLHAQDAPAEDPPAPEVTPPTVDPAQAIKKLDASRYSLSDITFDKTTRSVSFPAKVNMAAGPLEYGIVQEAGKAHEALLTTKISPFDLNVVLLLVNQKPCTAWFDNSDPDAGAMPVAAPKVNPESPMDVQVAWKDAEGKEQTARIESWMLNIDKEAPVTAGPWVYTGSFLLSDGRFMAQEDGSILALYTDAAAVFNNPREGRENDDIWIPNKETVPPKGTAVTVTLLPSKNLAAADPSRKPAPSGR